MNNAAKGWANDDGSRRKAQSERSKTLWNTNPPRGGRPKGSKNKNPYPRSQAVLMKFKNNPPPSWSGKKHKPETIEKMSVARIRWMNKNGTTGGYQAWMSGKFKPNNPEKYEGNPTQIQYRSSWELKMMVQLDNNPDVIQWSSEEVRVPYRSKADGQMHTYFPDFLIKTKNKTILAEVKPKKETQVPLQPAKINKKYVKEVMTYAKNISKWESAMTYAKSRGWEFQILTEDDLGINTVKKKNGKR